MFKKFTFVNDIDCMWQNIEFTIILCRNKYKNIINSITLNWKKIPHYWLNNLSADPFIHETHPCAPFINMNYLLTLAGSNYIHHHVWDEIYYPIGATVE